MKRYSPKVEHLLYRLYACRQSLYNLKRQGAPEIAFTHGNRAVAGYLASLDGLGLRGAELKQATDDRWLDFEGHEMKFDRMERCLTYMSQVQARVKAGVPRDHIKTFSCELHDDCMSCDCFNESTEGQRQNFDHGCDINTGEQIPGFQVSMEDYDKPEGS